MPILTGHIVKIAITNCSIHHLFIFGGSLWSWLQWVYKFCFWRIESGNIIIGEKNVIVLYVYSTDSKVLWKRWKQTSVLAYSWASIVMTAKKMISVTVRLYKLLIRKKIDFAIIQNGSINVSKLDLLHLQQVQFTGTYGYSQSSITTLPFRSTTTTLSSSYIMMTRSLFVNHVTK